MLRQAGSVVRDFELSNDIAAIKNIRREIGWAGSQCVEKATELCCAVGHTSVAMIDGNLECAVETIPGVMCLHEGDLPLCV